jgi:hypothetical protein
MRVRMTRGLAAVVGVGSLILAACGGASESPRPPEGTPTAQDVAGRCPTGADPDRTGPEDQARPNAVQGFLPAAVDADSAKLVALAHRQTWTLDLCNNTWQRQHAAPGPSSVFETQLVYDADSDVVFSWSPRERVAWHYDLEKDDWTRVASPPPAGELQDAVYEPQSGLVVLRDGVSGALWRYDGAWRQLAGRAGPGDGSKGASGCSKAPGAPYRCEYASFMVADPTRHQLLLVQTDPSSPGRTWRFDLATRRWARLDAVPPTLITGYIESGGEIAFDQTAEEAVLLGVDVMAAFDPATEIWRDISLDEPVLTGRSTTSWWSTRPVARTGHTLVYDPINTRVLLLGGMYRDDSVAHGKWMTATDVWAYEVAGDTWRQLVPSESQR